METKYQLASLDEMEGSPSAEFSRYPENGETQNMHYFAEAIVQIITKHLLLKAYQGVIILDSLNVCMVMSNQG